MNMISKQDEISQYPEGAGNHPSEISHREINLYKADNVFKKYIKETYDKIWYTLRDFTSKGGLIRHQIDSFDHFINHGIKKIMMIDNIVSSKSKNKKVIIEILDVHVSSPVIIENMTKKYITPQEARIRNFTYEGNICINVRETVIEKNNVLINGIDETSSKKVNSEVYNNVCIGKIPIMLYSSKCNLYDCTVDERVALGECPYDSGGYFIVNGKSSEKCTERILITQERNCYNNVNVIHRKSTKYEEFEAVVRSMSEDTGHSEEVKLYTDEGEIKMIINKLKNKKVGIPIGLIFKALGYNNNDILKLIDIIGRGINGENNISQSEKKEKGEEDKLLPLDEKYIEKLDKLRDYINSIIFESNVNSELSAYTKIKTYIVSESPGLESSINCVKDLFPHLGINSTKKEKITYIIFILKKLLLTVLGIRPIDNRDNISNKRYETAGILFYELYRNIHKQWCGKVKDDIEKNKNILNILTKDDIITVNIADSLTNSEWGVKRNKYKKLGVSQPLNIMNYICAESHKRRIANQISKDGKGKNLEIRKMNTSQIFFKCPSETPEGQKVGIITNMAYTAAFTNKIDTVLIKDYIESKIKYDENENKDKSKNNPIFINVNKANLSDILDYIPILLNGTILGFVNNPEEFSESLRADRRNGKIDFEVSITYDFYDREIRIWCDEGRVIRPLLRLEKMNQKYYNKVQSIKMSKENVNKEGINNTNKLSISKNSILTLKKNICSSRLPLVRLTKLPTWDYLVNNNIIEYLHSDEIEYNIIALTVDKIWKNPNTNYCELHPSLMLGICTGNIPFSDDSQSPRNCYGSSMGKQALGCYSLSHKIRTYTIGHIMMNSQRPLVATQQAQLSNYNALPSGLNANVAICCLDGYNQEDSVLISKAAVDRGLFTLITEKTFCAEEKKKNSYDKEVIIFPDEEIIKNTSYRYNYSYLDENGIIKRGSHVKKNDVLVGKVLIKQNKKEGTLEKTDCSVVIKDKEDSGIVSNVIITTTYGGNKLIKIVISKVRIPEEGDKFCSRLGQKGTCGKLVPVENLPYNPMTGLTPDIIINSHAIPSRMTINQILETIMGKVCALEGKFIDCTTFGKYCNKDDMLEVIENTLIKNGMDRYGWETLHCGITGEALKCKVFCGPTYYQRLKHFVDDKIHARGNDGPITTLTRQPLEGRSRGGGLRLGEMEKDNMISHGLSANLKGRMMDMSDGYKMIICNNCGKPSKYSTVNYGECNVCKNSDYRQISIPYCFKLANQYMNGMCMRTDLYVE